MNDREFQVQLNNFRRKHQLGPDIEYHKVVKLDDLKGLVPDA